MSGPANETPGDSTPSLNFLREHDDGSRTRWPEDPDHDSATDMLPPDDEAAHTQPDSVPNAEADEADESGCSIHQPVTPAGFEDPEPAARVEPAEATSSASTEDLAAALEDDDASHVADEPASLESADTAMAAVPSTDDASPVAPRGNLLVVVLASYASAITIALLYLLFHRGASLLESLPDVPPLQEGELLRLVPVEAEMPSGHTLALGQSQRFGNIVVTPLRVVREPLAFEHFSGRDDLTKPETEPVIKLWVRFSNVSREQSIAPLDSELLFTRDFRPETGETRANQFVCSLDTKLASGEPMFVYDHSPTDEFDLVDQQLGQVLQPGESYETYIPTTEDALDSLNGELIWRVHFRKGYSPKGFGVTTVVEVKFDQQSIDSSSAAT